MQNQYVGDIGDYIKFALLRAVCGQCKLGIAWYLFPNEPHKGDGRHVGYLDHPKKWADLDPELFHALHRIVRSGKRDVATIENARLFESVVYAGEPLLIGEESHLARATWRENWFNRTLKCLAECDIVFADPDNGPKHNDKFRFGTRRHWKSIPLNEILILANHRTAIIYFHNTHAKGGHAKETHEWLQRLPKGSLAVYCTASSCRTFFIINPTANIRQRTTTFVDKWSAYVSLVSSKNEGNHGSL